MSRKPIKLEFKYKEQQLPENLNSFYAQGNIKFVDNLNQTILKVVSSDFNINRISLVNYTQIAGDSVVLVYSNLKQTEVTFVNLDTNNIIKVFNMDIIYDSNIKYPTIKLIVFNESDANLALESYTYDNDTDEVGLDDGTILVKDT